MLVKIVYQQNSLKITKLGQKNQLKIQIKLEKSLHKYLVVVGMY